MDLIREEVKELEDAVKDKDYKETLDALGDIVYVAYGMATSMGIDLQKVFDIIHQSNMSKLCKTEEQAIRSVQYYKDNMKDTYPTPAYRKSDDGQYFIVFNQGTGKILKNRDYVKVDLSSIFKGSNIKIWLKLMSIHIC